MRTLAPPAMLLALLAGCSQTPKAVERAPVESARVAAPQPQDDPACGLAAYPFPRSYEQMLADAPAGKRRPVTEIRTRSAIGPEGNVTHLRFMNLSSLDAVNRAAYDAVRKWRYTPAVVNGERVAVCSEGTITIDLSY